MTLMPTRGSTATVASQNGSARTNGHAPALPAVRRGMSERGVLAVASAGAFLAFLDATIVNIAFPDIQRSFAGESTATLSWIFNAYNIVFAAFLVGAGRVADLLGRRRTFVGGILLFTVASGLCGLATSAETLIAARAVQALGAAMLVPASIAIVLAVFPAERRNHAVALWGASAALAAGLGPPIGGALVDAANWRWAFLVNLPLGVAAVFGARRVLVETRTPGQRAMPDIPGSLLLAAAMGALTLAIVQGDGWGWTSAGVLGAFGASIALWALVGRRLHTHPSPVVEPALLRIRAFSVSNALTLAGGAGYYAYLLCNILFLTSVWDYGLLDAGLATVPGALMAAAVAGPIGRRADALDARVLLVPGAVLWAGAYVWYAAMAGPEPDFLGEWLPGQLLSGAGAGMVLPLLGSVAIAAVPGGRYATGAAIASSSRQLGGALGLALLLVVLGTPEDPAAALAAFDRGWLFSCACFAVVAGGAIAIGRVERAADRGADTALVTGPASSFAALHDGALPAERDSTAVEALGTLTPARLLRRTELLGQLPVEDLDRLAEAATIVRVDAGNWLFHEGDPPDGLYVVSLGRLEVLHEHDGSVLDVLGRGGVVGELGVLSGRPRAASVRAVRDAELLRITGDALDSALGDAPGVARRLLARLAHRVQVGPGPPPERDTAPRVIAVVSDLPGDELHRVVARVDGALRPYGSVLTLRESDAHGLERAEREHPRVLLIAGGDAPGEWQDFARRHADRALIVARTDAPPPAPGHGLREPEVLLLGRRPTGPAIATWQAAAGARRVTIVPAGPEGDLAILAVGRRLAGRATGIVLSGGGARALSHIGVLEVLEETGIAIDRVAGCSMGAIIGALYAMGLSPEAIDAAIYEQFVRRSPLNDYRLSSTSLLRGRKVEFAVRHLFGELLIEELPREFAAVSVDLNSRELVELRRGPVVNAVGASSSLPALLPPVVLDGRVLVDGGVLNNLPVEQLAATGDGPVIAVDVTERREPVAGTGEVPVVPGLLEILVRGLTLGSVDTVAAAAQHAAMVIRPAPVGAGMFEFHQIDELREAGRVAAREALALDGRRLSVG